MRTELNTDYNQKETGALAATSEVIDFDMTDSKLCCLDSALSLVEHLKYIWNFSLLLVLK